MKANYIKFKLFFIKWIIDLKGVSDDEGNDKKI